ncbi:MAG: Enoyl-CoA hydratase/isomerase [Frankiales bacterium]|nr:Enoyl-CoA hydratase/isomerase [Frankiales bacterium]
MTITTERRGRILVIRNERASKRNAIDAETTAGLDAALNLLQSDPDLWVGVLTGTDTLFSAGSDLADGPGDPTALGGEYGVIRRRRTKPLIAAVEGLALGGGLEIVLACDLVVAGRGASFGLPETTVGVIATCAGLFRTQRALPLNVARQLLLTGQRLNAERAWSLGLVNELVDDGAALDGALRLAEQVCLSSPTSVAATLTALQEVVDAQDAVGWEATARALATVSASANAQEGIAAFLEKRSPQWIGE